MEFVSKRLVLANSDLLVACLTAFLVSLSTYRVGYLSVQMVESYLSSLYTSISKYDFSWLQIICVRCSPVISIFDLLVGKFHLIVTVAM